jgi:spore maturation protein CgeB
MKKAKRIFVISDFKDEKTWSICLDERRLIKGLIRSGHDVQRFSHRNILLQSSLIASKRFAKIFGQKKTDDILLKQIKYYYPDIVLAYSMKFLRAQTAVSIRQAAPDAMLVGRDGDPFPEMFPERIKTAKEMDIMIMTSAGKFLETYKNAGVKKCAFLPSTCDPDIQYKYDTEQSWKTDITFLGTEEHSRIQREEDRYKITKKLSEMPNAKLYGCFGRPKTEGLDSFRAISGAKIGLSINIANDVYLYHSDRFINIPACGAFMLAKKTPGYELMFEDGIHTKYFDSADEFFELADWYLKHDSEREKIAQAGMEHAHREFNCTKIASCLIDLIEKGSYDAPWKVIF